MAPLAAVLPALVFVACSDESFVQPGHDASADANANASDAGHDTQDATPADASTDSADAAPFDGAAVPVQCSVPSCVVALVAADEHYCATMHDRSVRCWGDVSALPQPSDDGTEPDPGKPTPLVGLGTITDIAMGANGTCTVDDAGAVWCWNGWARTPTQVADIPPATRVFVGPGGLLCELTRTSELVCWGDSELGFGVRTMALDGPPVRVGLGGRTGFAGLADGRLFSWGFGKQLGHTYSGPEPMPVYGLLGPEVLAVGDNHACARTSAGELFCWGQGTNGELGTGTWRDEATPARVALPASLAALSVSTTFKHTCVNTTSNEVYCWGGTNARGELGQVAKQGVYTPTLVTLPPGAPLVDVAVGKRSSCVLRSDGSVLCWGDNTLGQLGRGSTDEKRHPEPQAVVFP